ncbi:MAG TPA: universal stress protein, partial [Roseiflexaceae bacterium]|nr:universal stress protein [Roseiflexaceae bacterium]
LAEQVLPSIRILAPILDAKVRLLQVVLELDQYYLAMDFELNGSFASQRGQRLSHWDLLRQSAEDYLERQAAQLRAAGVETTFEVRIGAPAEIIVEVAEREQATLIAMATHGYSGLKRWALGSVADKVLHAANVPVFVVRGSAQPLIGERSLRRILVPLDGSALAQQALPLAVELAMSTRAELILLTVQAPRLGDSLDGVSSYPHSDELLAALRDRVLGELGDLADELCQQQVPIIPVAAEGFPAEAIIDEAARRHVDLIVMATHGYSGIKRWALGSIADKVLHAATTPVMLVRAKDSA